MSEENFYSSANEDGKTSPWGNFSSAINMGHCNHGGCEPYGRNIDGRTSSRPSFTRNDYESLHPSEALPCSPCDIAYECQKAYEQVGIVRNVIDLMVDFAVAGISVIHPASRNQDWYQNWFQRVRGPEISEALVRNLLIYGRFIVREEEHITLGRKLNKDIQNNKAEASTIQTHRSPGKKIPVGYTCLNPCMIDVKGGSASTLTNEEPIYGIRLPWHLRDIIKNPKSQEEKQLVNSLPEEFKNPSFDGFIELDQKNLKIVHYKKDDWQIWAKPMIYSILADIKLLNKLRLADFNILDSAMDMVRIFKLGNLEHRIIPEAPAFQKLSESLQASNPGGIRTILWTPDIEMEESRLEGYDILGSDKYVATNNRIHAGLGVPPTLTGSHSTSGSTNNLTSLKTLVKRLVYVRRKLSDFWLSEFEQLRKVKRHRICPSLQFDILNLGDEEAEKKIWIDLFDRNVISQEWLQVKIDANPEVETARQNREHKQRINKKRVPRSTPGLHDPQIEDKCKKSLVLEGKLEPAALNLVGVEDSDFIDGAPSENSPQQNDEIKNVDKGGRPPGSRDQQPRKSRRFKPVVRAAKIKLAAAQQIINEVVNEAMLEQFGKANMRQLSQKEHAQAEKVKCFALLNWELDYKINEESVATAVSKGVPSTFSFYKECESLLAAELGRAPTIPEKKDLQIEIYIEGASLDE